MNDANTGIEPRLAVIDGMVSTTSLEVAEYFGKKHDNVLRDIRKAISEVPGDFSLLNFEESTWINPRGKKYPMFRLSRDGFSYIATGFTGKRVAQWKVAYFNAFNAFNAMEHELIQLRLKAQTDAARRDIEKELRDAFAHSDADWIVKLRSADKNTLPPLVFICFLRVNDHPRRHLPPGGRKTRNPILPNLNPLGEVR